jgi:hypothetical protein
MYEYEKEIKLSFPKEIIKKNEAGKNKRKHYLAFNTINNKDNGNDIDNNYKDLNQDQEFKNIFAKKIKLSNNPHFFNSIQYNSQEYKFKNNENHFINPMDSDPLIFESDNIYSEGNHI